MFNGIKRALSIAVAALLVLLLVRTHTGVPAPGEPASVKRQVHPVLRHMESAIDDGAATAMQAYFPEGFVFTHVLTGLAWVELGLAHPSADPLRLEAYGHAKEALRAVGSSEGTASFPAELDPAYGVFHAGWSNRLRAGVLLLLPPEQRAKEELAELGVACEQLAQAFDRSDTPFLEAYLGSAWPVDSVVAISTLPLCDRLTGSDYQPVVDRWLELAKRSADPASGVLGHGAFPGEERPRATSLTIITRFLHEVDPVWARQHYDHLMDNFLVTRGGLPAFQEYADGARAGDVDSGPLILGVSISATVVGAGVATLYGDHRLAGAILGLGEAVGLPSGIREKHYLCGVLPVGEAFVVWSKTARPWLEEPLRVSVPSIQPPWWWRLPWELPGWLIVCWLLIQARGSND